MLRVPQSHKKSLTVSIHGRIFFCTQPVLRHLFLVTLDASCKYNTESSENLMTHFQQKCIQYTIDIYHHAEALNVADSISYSTGAVTWTTRRFVTTHEYERDQPHQT